MTANTNGYGGYEYRKTIKVYTNEPNSRVHRLYIKGKVDLFAAIKPKQVILSGNNKEHLEQVVKIRPRQKYPFEIKEIYADKGTDIRFSLEPQNEAGQPVYLVRVVNTRTKPGEYKDTLRLVTTHPLKKKLRIRVRGIIGN